MKSAGKLNTHPSRSPQSTYRKSALSNGIRVISEEIHGVRSVSLGVWVDVGSRDEKESDNGIAHFIEHMAFKGTRKRSVRDIAQSLESVGGYLNAFTGKEHTCFYARVLDEFAPLAIDVLSDIVLNATFPEKEIEKEKGVVIEELKNAEDDPDDIIHDYFEKAIFGSHPMGFPVIGTEKSLRSFGRKQLRDYLEKNYAADRTVVAAAGNIRHETFVELVNRYFGRMKTVNRGGPSGRTRPKSVPPEQNEFRRPIQQAHVCLGTVGYSMKHKLRYPLMILNALLGDGMSSRLFQNIREKYGFAYNVYSFANMMSDAGTFGAYIGTDDKHVNESIDLIWREFKKIHDHGITKSELERTKAQLKGGMMLSLESIPNRMMRLGSSELYYGQFSSMDSIIRQVEAVTMDEVRATASELLKKEDYSTIIFRPSKP